MSQENQLQTQVYVLRRPFRATTYGGRDETHVFTLKENVVVEVMPTISRRSRTGRHGEDEWYLKDGKYVVVDISRGNNVRHPFTVTVWCYVIEDGTATRRELATFYENTVEDALMRAEEFVHEC